MSDLHWSETEDLLWEPGVDLHWSRPASPLPDVVIPAPVPPVEPAPVLRGAVYRFVSVTTIGGHLVGDVPLRDWRWGRMRNGAETISGHVVLPELSADPLSGARAAALVDALEPLRRCIVVERDGVPQAEFLIWTSDYDPETRTLSIGGAELWSYWRRRLIRWDAIFEQVDQHQIVRDLMARAQMEPGGNLGMAVEQHDSGVLRDRTEWTADAAKNLGEAVEQLSEVQGGFDFSLDVVRSGDGYQRVLRLGTPRRGRIGTGLTWTLGHNLVALSGWPVDGSATANSWVGIGGDVDEVPLRADATDEGVLAAGWPLLEDVVTHKDVSVQATLDAHTAGALADARLPRALPKAVVNGAMMPAVGSWIAGDDARLIVEPGTDPRWPDGLDVTVRVAGWRVPDPGTGPELVEVTFEQVLPGSVRGAAHPDTEAAWRRDVNRRLRGVER